MVLSLFVLCLSWFLISTTLGGSNGQTEAFRNLKLNYRVNPITHSSLKNIARLYSPSSSSNSADYFTMFNDTNLPPLLQVRAMNTPGHEAAKQHIKSTFTNLNWSYEEDNFEANTPIGKVSFSNIIVSSDRNADRFLVLACHYDSKLFTSGVFIGASDSAVPCAMLMTIAQALNKYVNPDLGNKVALKFFFFDGEEAFGEWTNTDSIYGARHLAEQMYGQYVSVQKGAVKVNKLDQIDLFVLLDLIGPVDTRFRNVISSTSEHFYKLSTYEDKLKRFNLLSATAPSSYFNNHFTNAGIGDDHLPFMRRYVRILHLISYPFPSVWHTLADDDKHIHYPTVQDLLKIFTAFVAEYLNITVQ